MTRDGVGRRGEVSIAVVVSGRGGGGDAVCRSGRGENRVNRQSQQMTQQQAESERE